MSRAVPTESDIPLHGWAPYSEVHRERIRAHAKHADRSIEALDPSDPDWLAVLVEEVGEVAKAIIENGQNSGMTREELVQVAAVTCAWIEAIDRG